MLEGYPRPPQEILLRGGPADGRTLEAPAGDVGVRDKSWPPGRYSETPHFVDCEDGVRRRVWSWQPGTVGQRP